MIHRFTDGANVDGLQREQLERWQKGQRIPAETFLLRYPGLQADAEGTLDLVYGEFILREALGETPTLAEFQWRFPQFAQELYELVELERSLEQVAADPVPVEDPTQTNVAAGAEEPSADLPKIPGYQVLDILGSGGMGVVYQARQESLNRIVALKMLRTVSPVRPEDRLRFRMEGETLASLQHPHIVQVHEVGEWRAPDGAISPFLALEFMEGGSLDRWMKGRQFPVMAAAAMVEILARAVHAAHQRGIIHRDLKPSNVLLRKVVRSQHSVASSQTEARSIDCWPPVMDYSPKIADFGLAKFVDSHISLTQPGTLLGTPAYMAPEQIGGVPQALTPACDVYALGVILYELLAGRAPFEGATPLAVLDQVQSTEPPAPSFYQRRVPLDLDTICLKCLNKNPLRRYASAESLAEDLRRFKRGEPIQARRVRTWERMLKWAKRRPAAAALVIVVGVALISLVGGGLWYQAQLHAALWKAERERDRAALSFRQARQAVDEYFTRVSESHLLDKEGLQPLRHELLSAALRYYQDFLLQRSDDPTVLAECALTWQRVAWITSVIGSKEEAAKACLESVQLFDSLVNRVPRSYDYELERARALDLLGWFQGETGKLEEGLVSHDRAQATWDAMTRINPASTQARCYLARNQENRGFVLRNMGRFSEAQRAYDDAHALRRRLVEENPDRLEFQYDLAIGRINAGLLRAQRYEHADALACFVEARCLSEKLVAKNPAELDWQRCRAKSYVALGGVYRDLDRREEALEYLQTGRDHWQNLLQASPAVTEFQAELSESLEELAKLHRASRRWSEARRCQEDAHALWLKLCQAHPSETKYRIRIADSHTANAMLLDEVKKPADALAAYREAIRLGEELYRSNATDVEVQKSLAMTYGEAGSFHKKAGSPSEAWRCFERAEFFWEKLARAHPQTPNFMADWMVSVVHLGDLDLASSRSRQALGRFQQAQTLAEELTRSFPKVACAQQCLALGCAKLGEWHATAGNATEALRYFKQACRAGEDLLRILPQRTLDQSDLGMAWENQGRVLRRQGHHQEAVEAFRNAVKAQRLAFEKAPNQKHNELLSGHYLHLETVLRDLGRYDEASTVAHERDLLRQADGTED
jgi:serine/threonine protein kinase/tetratricopeptide (TPR) repeat protein